MADEPEDFVVRPRHDEPGMSCGPDPALERIQELTAPAGPITQEHAEKIMEGIAVPSVDGTYRTKAGMMRFNSGKLRMSLVPASYSQYAAKVLEYGAIKYSPNNWRRGGNWTEIYESLQRHIDSFREGEDFDPESGLPHLSHAAFNLMVLIEFFDKGLGNDDRFRYEGQPVGSLLAGRVLEFRQPPVQSQPETGTGAGAGDAGAADQGAG